MASADYGQGVPISATAGTWFAPGAVNRLDLQVKRSRCGGWKPEPEVVGRASAPGPPHIMRSPPPRMRRSPHSLSRIPRSPRAPGRPILDPMNRRTRLPAALLALFSLFAYVGESVAAVCAPPVETHASAESAADAHAHHAPVDAPESPDVPDTDQARPCPLGMSGAGSTCVAAPLPAAGSAGGTPALDRTPVLALHDETRDRLLVAPHFRPPRA
jgi:hypothetical protein